MTSLNKINVTGSTSLSSFIQKGSLGHQGAEFHRNTYKSAADPFGQILV